VALVRIYLLTYRRPHLLERALTSLLAQTFRDWVCEVHNDAPDDPEPATIVELLREPRIQYFQHQNNLGPVRSFNLAYEGGPEPLLSILEDDNWWEPQFLETAVEALAANPDANVVWSNMRIWTENPDRSWSDTGTTIWRIADDNTPAAFSWPNPVQATDAIHSQGAMVARSAVSRCALVPEQTSVSIIEHLRERLLPGRWLLLKVPLANFAVTRQTARSSNRGEWACAQALVAASYFEGSKPSPHVIAGIWQTLRNARPPSTGALFVVALSGISSIAILRHSTIRDWTRFVAGAIRHPIVLARALRYRQRWPDVWQAALRGAKARSRERCRQDTPRIFKKHIGELPARDTQAS
jgi:hypothetical protein